MFVNELFQNIQTRLIAICQTSDLGTETACRHQRSNSDQVRYLTVVKGDNLTIQSPWIVSIALCLATYLTFQEGICQSLSEVSTLVCANDETAILRIIRLSDRKSDTYMFEY